MEIFLKYSSFVLRKLPHFRGKHKLGKLFEKIILPFRTWKKSVVVIRMKNGLLMQIDAKSKTHNGAFWTGEYDDSIIKKLSALFDQNWIVLDVGGNIGYYAVAFARELKRLNGILYVFEPVKQNFITLRSNLLLNDLGNNSFTFPLALGNERGSIDVNITEEGETSNAYIVKGNFKVGESTRSEKVVIERLDDFANSNGITGCDFIKIDIEGAEIFFMQGGVKFIEKFRPIIYGEFNSYFLKRFGYTFLDVWGIIENLGYDCYVQEDRKALFTFAIPNEDSENLLLVPKEYQKEKIRHLIKNR